MRRINIFLLLAAVIIMCCGCAGTSENEENVKGMSEYQKAQLDVAEVYGFGKTHDGYVWIYSAVVLGALRGGSVHCGDPGKCRIDRTGNERQE